MVHLCPPALLLKPPVRFLPDTPLAALASQRTLQPILMELVEESYDMVLPAR